MRRVITGIDEHGRSVFVSDEDVAPQVPPTLGGMRHWMLWGEDDTPSVPSAGAVRADLSLLPATPRGHRFIVMSFPPASARSAPPDDLAAAIAESERMLPGLGELVTSSDGMHATPTVDLEYIIAGELRLELDDGAATTLRAGDCLVQCGARHRWENRSDDWATMLLVFVGAELDADRGASAARKRAPDV